MQHLVIFIFFETHFFTKTSWQFGNLARHSWGTVVAQLGHKIVFPGAHLGHSWGKKLLGAHLGQMQLGTVEAKKMT